MLVKSVLQLLPLPIQFGVLPVVVRIGEPASRCGLESNEIPNARAAIFVGAPQGFLSDLFRCFFQRSKLRQPALCVFVKTKEPRIEWYFSSRRPQDLAEYLAKVENVAAAIAAGHFYKRPGKWCSYCDFLPLCVGDQAKARETLVRIDSR